MAVVYFGGAKKKKKKGAFDGKSPTSVDLAITLHIYASVLVVIHSCRSSAAKHIPEEPSLETISFIRMLVDWPSLSYPPQQEFGNVGYQACLLIIKTFYRVSIVLVLEPCGRYQLLITIKTRLHSS